MCTFFLNCSRRCGFDAVKTMLHEVGSLKRKNRRSSDACVILSSLSPATPIPSGEVERELRKLKGIRKITINPLFGTVKIRYDPNITTVEVMRSRLKRLLSRRALEKESREVQEP